jgi:hypothetical protein
MAQTGLPSWKQSAALNASSDAGINFAEGQAPSSVNDSARGLMASAAKWRDDLNGSLVTAGTSTAYTLATNTGMDALAANYQVAFQVNADNGGTTTLNVDSKGAKPLRSAAGVELVAGQLKNGGVYAATYFTSNSGEWILHAFNPVVLADSQVATAKIADAAVTLAKMANLSAGNFIVRKTASTGVPEVGTFGAGLLLDASTGIVTAPAFPPPSSFSELVIKVASNTTVTVTGKVCVTDGSGSYKTVTLNSTVNLGTNGAVDRLDTGTIATSTWYALHAIDTVAGAPGVIASTSGTSPSLPSGYTYKARIGWVRTVSGSATLYGTWQLGREATYVVGLAQTTISPQIDSGIKGTFSQTSPTLASVNISAFVPTTAAKIMLNVGNQLNSGSSASVLIAPSTAYGGTNNGPTGTNGQMWPLFINGSSVTGCFQVTMALESTSTIAWASNNAGCISAAGWVDNI